MLRTAVRADGTIPLGDAAHRLGFTPGTLVDVIVTSAGTLILAVNDTVTVDLVVRPLKSRRPPVALPDRRPA